jgi:acyl-coenzyme A synthetase/AMP-(fatty) acid ligase
VLRYEDLPHELNLASWFVDRRLEEGRGDRTALTVGDDASYTFAELAARLNRVGNVFRELDVRPEERVLIALSDGIDFVATWYGALKVGAVVAEVYTFLQAKDYAYFLRYTRAPVAVVDKAALGPLRAASASSPHLRALLVVGRGDEELLDGEHDFDVLVARASDDLEPAPTSRDDIAIWKFTTGSTGAPKAAVHLAHDPVLAYECYARTVLDLGRTTACSRCPSSSSATPGTRRRCSPSVPGPQASSFPSVRPPSGSSPSSRAIARPSSCRSRR